MNRQPTEWKEILANDVRAADIEKKLVVTSREREEGRGKMGYGIKRHKLLCSKKISNKDILYSSYCHYLVIIFNGV